MTPNELQDRTFQFAVSIVKLCRTFPRDTAGYVAGRQLIRAATAVGANYRAARRSRSAAEFVSRIAVVLEEADEADYWLTLAGASELVNPALAEPLTAEAAQLRAIFARSYGTARGKLR